MVCTFQPLKMGPAERCLDSRETGRVSSTRRNNKRNFYTNQEDTKWATQQKLLFFKVLNVEMMGFVAQLRKTSHIEEELHFPISLLNSLAFTLML